MLPTDEPQVAGTEDAEAIKASVAALKRVCRQRTMVAWKEWRASMEAHCGASLRVRARRCRLRYVGVLLPDQQAAGRGD